jgi:DNA-binding MarR family transcriptional regulator
MTQWLSPQEQQAWRAWLDASRLLNAELSRELNDSHGLSLADYEILVQLSETEDRRMRLSELADRTFSSRSRLSHQIDRMEKAGLVEREACTGDARGFWAVLTDTGWNKIVAAAPDHVAGVRTHLVDQLTPAEFQQLGNACRTIVNHLDAQGERSFPSQ